MGTSRSMRMSVSTSTPPTPMRANHLRMAGSTYRDAHSLLVLLSTAQTSARRGNCVSHSRRTRKGPGREDACAPPGRGPVT
jgi:hypothetical protein